MHHGRPYTAARFRFCPWCGLSVTHPESPPLRGPLFIEWNYDTLVAREYERSGECNGCGDCCRTVFNMKMFGGEKTEHGGLAVDGKGIWTEIVSDSEDEDDREFIRFSITEEDRPCSALLPDGKCTQHGPRKQWCCRVFPTSPRDIDSLPNCSYEFTEIRNWVFEDGEGE